MSEAQMSNNHKFVNLWQTNEERQGKYWLVKSLGGTVANAIRMRDWRLSKIERFYGLDRSNQQKPELERIIVHQHAIPATIL